MHVHGTQLYIAVGTATTDLAIVRRNAVIIHTSPEVISCNGTQTHACCGCTGYGFKTVDNVMGF